MRDPAALQHGKQSDLLEPIDPWLTDKIYLHDGFKEYFDSHAKRKNQNGEYPTVTVRQIMWALRMKPLKKERWETVFDRSTI